MVKYDYFEVLEELSLCAYNTVKQACSDANQGSKKAFSETRAKCNRTLLSLENMLFQDFLPPLERDNIATYAHCLLSLTDTAGEHMALSNVGGMPRRRSEEERICIDLAQELNNSTSILRKLKKPGELPDIQKFRDLLHAGLEAHSADISKINSGILPRSSIQQTLSAGKLRASISRCFDTLLEIMLNNI